MRDENTGDAEEDHGVTVCVKVPLVEGANGESREDELKVPGLTRKVREKEETLNDLGYRMSWSQSRSFANRVLFLQRGCKWILFFLLPLRFDIHPAYLMSSPQYHLSTLPAHHLPSHPPLYYTSPWILLY